MTITTRKGPENNRQVKIRLDLSLISDLDHIADQMGVSRNAIIKIILSQHLTDQKILKKNLQGDNKQ